VCVYIKKESQYPEQISVNYGKLHSYRLVHFFQPPLPYAIEDRPVTLRCFLLVVPVVVWGVVVVIIADVVVHLQITVYNKHAPQHMKGGTYAYALILALAKACH